MSTDSACEVAAVERLTPEWEALVDSTRCNRVFCSPAWFLAACHCDRELKPQVITVRRDGRLAALLPLVFDGATLRFATSLTDYNDVLASDDDAARVALVHALDEPRPLVLERMREDAHLYRAVRALDLPLERDREMSYVELRDGYDAFLRTRGRNLRWNIGATHRRAAAAGAVATELTPADLTPAELPGVFFPLHLQRIPWSVLKDVAGFAFVREVMPSLFAQRRLRVFAVRVATRIVAIDVCTTGNESLGLWNGGFDMEFAALSPGRLLLDFLSRLICAEAIGELDLLRGEYFYKRQWRTGVRVTWRFTR